MSRVKLSILNFIASTVMSLVVIVVGFITQKYFIDLLGLEYSGINGLFTNIVSMLGIVELGFGSAIVFHLYKPVADGNGPLIKSIMNFYKIGYRLIAAVVLSLGLMIIPFLGLIVGATYISENIHAIFLLFIIDITCSYLIAYKRSMLYADQKNYIINSIHIICVIIMNCFQIAALVLTGSFYLYLLVRIILRITENVIITAIVNKKYPFLNSGKNKPIDAGVKSDIVKKVKALSIHKLSEFVILGSDNIVISIFLGIKTVGLYNNYYLVIASLTNIVNQAFSSISASIGNLIIGNDSKKSFDIYKKIQFINYWIASVAAIGIIISMDSFIKMWIGNEYLLPFGVLLAIGFNFYLQLMRATMSSFKNAAGIFYEDRFVPVIESIVNIVFSVIFLQFFGLVGVFMGTIMSNLVLHLFSYPKFVYIRLFKKRYIDYYCELFGYFLLTMVAGLISFVISRLINIDNAVIHLLINCLISIAVPSVMFYFVYRNSDEFKYFKNLIIRILIKINRFER